MIHEGIYESYVKILDRFSQSHEIQKEHKFRMALHVTFEKLRRKC